MRAYTKEEVEDIIDNAPYPKEETLDSQGQLIMCFGVFKWKDGTYRDEPEKLVNGNGKTNER